MRVTIWVLNPSGPPGVLMAPTMAPAEARRLAEDFATYQASGQVPSVEVYQTEAGFISVRFDRIVAVVASPADPTRGA